MDENVLEGVSKAIKQRGEAPDGWWVMSPEVVVGRQKGGRWVTRAI